jgi:hypothetical protein
LVHRSGSGADSPSHERGSRHSIARRHDAGRVVLVNQFDGFHEFLTALEATNPSVEIRGC